MIHLLTLALGFYMAWNIGANDVSNAMGTSVGSKALTLKKAVFIAAFLEFSGAFFLGSNVCKTIQEGILDPHFFANDPMIFALGMVGALLSTGLALQIASYFGLPVSTTHAIVGSILGFGLSVGGVHVVNWNEILWIVSSWILSPCLSGVLSYFIFSLIQRKILYALDPVKAAGRLFPFFVFLCFLIVSLSFHPSLLFAISVALPAALGAYLTFQKLIPVETVSLTPYHSVSLEKAVHHLQRVRLGTPFSEEVTDLLSRLQTLANTVKNNSSFSHPSTNYQNVENIFITLQILSACLVAFAHGANDVANAIGPVAAALTILKTGTIHFQTETPPWLLFLGGAGIVIGLATWGWRVIETVGRKITELTPTRGFSAELGAAIAILLASKLGLPISTTHALIGAVFGVGLARGLRALNLQTIREIVVSWIITLPFCAALSILSFRLLKICFM